MLVYAPAGLPYFNKPMQYKDVTDDPEDERIRQIGEAVMKNRLVVGFFIDSEPGKADRYIAKLKKKFPGIRVIFKGDGPIPDTTFVKLGPPTN